MGRFKLDQRTRTLMLKHLAENPPRIPDVLTDQGRRLYLDLIRMAFAHYDEEWLSAQLVLQNLLRTSRLKNGQNPEREAYALAVKVFEEFAMVAILEAWLEDHPEALGVSSRQQSDWIFDPQSEADIERFLAKMDLVEPYSRWIRCWCEVLLACQKRGGDVSQLRIKRPAKEQEVVAVEHTLGRRLPASLRRVFREFSSGFEFNWSLGDKGISSPIDNVSSGGFERIELGWLIRAEEDRRGWIEAVFNDPHDPYDAVWHNTLLVIFVGNGDYIGIDLQGDDGFVTYLSHEGHDALHGKVLANNFQDFMDRWSLLGCVGPEDWQLEPFMSQKGLDPMGEIGQVWRRWLGLQC